MNWDIKFANKNNYSENEVILFVSVFKIVNTEGKDTKIKIWDYDENNVFLEKEITVGEYLYLSPKFDENYYFSETVDGIINTDISLFPESVIGIKEMINNVKEIRKWWLSGRNLLAFNDQFNSTKIELESEDEDEALKAGVDLSKNKDITIENTSFRSWYINHESVVNEYFSLAPNNNDKYLGLALFEFSLNKDN
ncbi:hypothetical protein [Spiroplasma cantharicola]|uniref:Uncharacterized protein n=1 Tax=Spiroplasma cantharicola TaxID=362837 RepID=A0A0M4K174_9MOLU|nr:hypothetical protein [Spiroplasma cantharicola]ALD66312.1 hypothetical protein SCANT_v1c04020 [Spiroplasma cantharicola]